MNKNVRQVLLPILASAIWGSAFIFQKIASNANVPAFTFNASRSIVAVIALLIIIAVEKIYKKIKNLPSNTNHKMLIIGGVLCGLCLAAATNLQQLGIEEQSPGKAGFLTAFYIILVPIITVLFGKKVGLNIWISVIFALSGLYFLSVTSSLTIAMSDIFLILCALVYAIHILLISYFTKYADCFELSCLQFFVCFIISAVIAYFTEDVSVTTISNGIIPILYVGIFSSAIAYTLQIIAEKSTNTSVVSLLMSLEAVFSAVFNAIFLKDGKMTLRELFGSFLMMCAVVLAQINFNNKKESQK